MGPFDLIEKLINEHGSSTIIGHHLSFVKEQHLALEKKVSDLQTQLGRLDAQLERERDEYKQAREELRRLKEEHAEDVFIEHAVEFRRGKRTKGKWMAFCPRCHAPATANQDAHCTARCGWHTQLSDGELYRILYRLNQND